VARPGGARGAARSEDPGATRLPVVSDAAVPATVLVFSQRAEVRAAVRTALGRSPAAGVGPLSYVECATGDEVVAAVDAGGIDLCVLDGEAQPTGGMGISRQLKYEIADCPALVVLIARQADRWLAHWSLADATLAYPIDPLTAADVVATQLRERASRRPAVRG
jgi:DNA-binding NtrC family response regulator